MSDVWVNLADDLVHGDFASVMTWRHITRTENVATGEVTAVNADQSFRGCITDPSHARMFSSDTLTKTSTAIIAVPQDFTDWTPSMLDQVSIATGQWLSVVDIKAVYAPGVDGPAVPVVLLVALGS